MCSCHSRCSESDWSPGQKLFEGRRVFLVFVFLSFVSGIKVVLKFAAKIDLFKSIARSIIAYRIITNGFPASFSRGRAFKRIAVRLKLAFRIGRNRSIQFSGAIRRRRAQLRFHRLAGRFVKTAAIVRAGQMIENLFRQLARFFLRRDFFEHRIFQQLLLNQLTQLERSHLQHLDALPQLGRQHETLR